jgi:hypothetical protein
MKGNEKIIPPGFIKSIDMFTIGIPIFDFPCSE